jgi:hypothetical protein
VLHAFNELAIYFLERQKRSLSKILLLILAAIFFGGTEVFYPF